MTFIKKHNVLKFGVTAGLLMATMISSDAFATGDDLASISDSLSNNLASVPTLFSSAAYIMGTGFTIAGLFKLKEHVDSPGDGNFKNAMIRLGVGALLILLPYTINASSNTLGDGGGDVTFNGVSDIN